MAISDLLNLEHKRLCLGDEYTAAQATRLINKHSIAVIDLEERPKSNKGISFLTQCPTVTSLLFGLTVEEEDLDALYEMPSLLHIDISVSNVEIDFSRMKMLESADLLWGPQIQSIFHFSNLKTLNINLITPAKVVDLSFLRDLKNLEKLTINTAKIQTLDGLKKLKKLKELQLDRLPKLTDISDIEKLSQIEYLFIRGSNKAVSLEKSLEKLISLRVLVLSEQKSIKNLAFVRKLKQLKTISLDRSTVVDGDMSPLLDKKLALEHAVFKNRKHYTHTFDEIYDILHGIKT